MKIFYRLSPDVPDPVLPDCKVTDTFAESEVRFREREYLKTEIIRIFFMDVELPNFDLPLKDLILPDCEDVRIELVLDIKANYWLKLLPDAYWVIHGTKSTFRVDPLDGKDSKAYIINSRHFYIVRINHDADGNKKYTAKLYKTFSDEYNKINVLTGPDPKIDFPGEPDRKIFRMVDGNVKNVKQEKGPQSEEKEIAPLDTLIETMTGPGPAGEDKYKWPLKPLLDFLNKLGKSIEEKETS